MGIWAERVRAVEARLNGSPDLDARSWSRQTTLEIIGGNGAVQIVPSYDMTRDGFTLLVMRFFCCGISVTATKPKPRR